jgi:hypothetical protein
MLNGTWRTVLLSGGREGGDSIFALDVTHPLSPAFLWQTRLPDGMRFNSDVEITSIGGEAVALVSSGPGQHHVRGVDVRLCGGTTANSWVRFA